MELFRTADHGLSPCKKSQWPNSSQKLASQKSFEITTALACVKGGGGVCAQATTAQE